MPTPRDLADRFFTAIERGDIDAVRACYAPDARIWHNTDGLHSPGQTVEENLATLGWVMKNLTDISYGVVRREATESGFVQQHVLRATHIRTGEAFAMPACVICVVNEGRIQKLDEYLDSGQLGPLAR